MITSKQQHKHTTTPAPPSPNKSVDDVPGSVAVSLVIADVRGEPASWVGGEVDPCAVVDGVVDVGVVDVVVDGLAAA